MLGGETGLSAPGPEKVHREFGRQHSDRRRGVLQSGVSCCTFLLDDVTVELAEQRVPIFLGAVGQANDEVFDLLARGIAQGLHATEIGRIRFDQTGIELMLANYLAETITDCAAAVVPVAICRLWQLLGLWTRGVPTREGTDFLDRADADAIGLSQSSAYRPRFRNSEFGYRALEEKHLKDWHHHIQQNRGKCRTCTLLPRMPTVERGVAEGGNRFDMNASATLSAGQSQQTCVGHIPTAIQVR